MKTTILIAAMIVSFFLGYGAGAQHKKTKTLKSVVVVDNPNCLVGMMK